MSIVEQVERSVMLSDLDASDEANAVSGASRLLDGGPAGAILAQAFVRRARRTV